MLLHVPDLERVINECARVLKPGKAMVLLVTLSTKLLYPGESEQLFGPLGVVSRNLSRQVMEGACDQAGLSITTREEIGAEHLEFIEEREGRYGRELMRLARMVRDKEEMSARIGDHRYKIALSLYYWSVYLLIGKLTDVIYILQV
jgi:hypothetical protein